MIPYNTLFKSFVNNVLKAVDFFSTKQKRMTNLMLNSVIFAAGAGSHEKMAEVRSDWIDNVPGELNLEKYGPKLKIQKNWKEHQNEE